MLPEEDIDKLCHGRIIYASIPRSDGKDSAGPHYAVILDSDEEIKEHDSYFVVVISNDDEIDPFRLPVPPKYGLTGFFQCSWMVEVALPGITKIWHLLDTPDMIKVLQTVRAAREVSARKKQSRSTQSY